MAPLVLGIDSSTQSTKALLVDAETGQVLEERRATHPDGTEVDPRTWLDAVSDNIANLNTATRSPSAASSTAWCCSTRRARWCGLRCCGTTPAPPTPRAR